MRLPGSFWRLIGLIGVGIAAQLSWLNTARADVIVGSPTLPLLGVPYVSSTGAGCFPLKGACITAGSLTLTSVVSSTFNPLGQDIVTNASFTGELTDLGGNPIGPVALSGTLEQEVIGRTFSTEPGSWSTEIVAMSLSGPVLGSTLTLSQDASHSSTGTTSLIADGGAFLVNSFFDVFVDLALDSNPPLNTVRGPLHFEPAATTVPEPAGLLVLAPTLIVLLAVGRLGRQPVQRRQAG
jgi:hypothetical protein